jgi:NAD(P)-dependent dehydrogenase (short-subunit alcohol dehydrogenase family)
MAAPAPRVVPPPRLAAELPPSGVAAALQYTSTGGTELPKPSALSIFSLEGRVALLTGGHRGIGLEMALALGEAGAIVYCIDLPSSPDETWVSVQKYLTALPESVLGGKGQLKYLKGDVTDQKGMWKIAEDIVEQEGRLDICVCNAGILTGRDCLEYDGEEFRKVRKRKAY